jgi:hypothetical protein
MNFRNLRISKKLISGFLFIELIFICGLIPVYLLLQRSSDLAREIDDKISRMARLSIEMKISVIQVQQWLTDISATRALEGTTTVSTRRKKYARLFKKQIDELNSLAPEMADKLKTIDSDFDAYYAMGKKMASVYIESGPSAGNLLMEQFDPYAEKNKRQPAGIRRHRGCASVRRDRKAGAIQLELHRNSRDQSPGVSLFRYDHRRFLDAGRRGPHSAVPRPERALPKGRLHRRRPRGSAKTR